MEFLLNLTLVSANCSSNETATSLISYPNPSNEGFYLDLYRQEFKGLTEITISDAKGVWFTDKMFLSKKAAMYSILKIWNLLQECTIYRSQMEPLLRI